ncbi:MAG: hypothetical protein JNL68_19125 [Burkholderiales bacterium]|nr:hypothetical protein [Burkholderiales bacterium]
MPPFDPEKFLSEPIYALDFGFMIGDVEDFLEFTESNVEWQFKREMLSIQRQAETEQFEPGYREHLEANAEHRFKVSLPLRVRYAALVALITSVEWSLVTLIDRLKDPLSKKPEKTNGTVHALRELESRLAMGANQLISEFEALVRVRDCIVHSAGLERHYKFKAQLPEFLSRIRGIYLGSWNFLGKHICIDRGALNQYISGLAHHVTALHEACHKKGLLNEDR